MRRLAALLALVLALPLAAQDAAYKLTQVAVRLDGGAGGSGFSTPSGCVATSVPIFLGSPVALGCDAGLTYDAGADTLTVGDTVYTNTLELGGSFRWQAFRYDGVRLNAGGDIRWGNTSGSWYSGIDSGLRRVSAGLVGVTDGSTGHGKLQLGGLQYVTGSRPTCDAAARGMTWYVAGGAGAADTIEVCGKSALDAYSWIALATF